MPLCWCFSAGDSPHLPSRTLSGTFSSDLAPSQGHSAVTGDTSVATRGRRRALAPRAPGASGRHGTAPCAPPPGTVLGSGRHGTAPCAPPPGAVLSELPAALRLSSLALWEPQSTVVSVSDGQAPSPGGWPSPCVLRHGSRQCFMGDGDFFLHRSFILKMSKMCPLDFKQ